MDPDRYQELLNERDDGDTLPAGVNLYQAKKCAAIILAGLDGHTTYLDETRNVARFLQAAAFESGHISVRLPHSADELRQDLDALPWPAPGRPAKQPD